MSKSLKKPAATKSKATIEVTLVSADKALVASAQSALEMMPGVKFKSLKGGKELVTGVKSGEGFLLLDDRLPDWNAYELCRRFKGTTRMRVIMLLHSEDRFGAGIARFCGADSTLELPLDAAALQETVETRYPDVKIDEMLRKAEKSAANPSFPEALLKDIAGEPDKDLVEAIIDPETKLFNYAFLTYKLDEEFKRSTRFKYPLSCVMVGFDGEASSEVLLDLSSIFLTHSRDTDVLGRFDLNCFLFLLPNTGLSGAKIMAERVLEAANRKKMKDLVGEPLEVSVGIAVCPHTSITEREDLFQASRRAFEKAQQSGGGVEIADGNP